DLRPHPPALDVVREHREEVLAGPVTHLLRANAFAVTRGQTPTLVWRVETQGKTIVIGSDIGGKTDADLLERFARGADVLVVPQTALEALEKPAAGEIIPTTIGRLARAAAVKQV